MNNTKEKQIQFIERIAQEQEKESSSSVKWTIIAVIICALILAAAYYFLEASKNPYLMSFNSAIEKTGIRSRFMSLMGNKNILILGVDSNGRHTNPFEGTRTDTILLVNISRNGKSINAISIPRDSKVYIAGNHGTDKINAAHAFGGPKLTVKTIEETFGVHIDNYIAVNYAGVKDFVQAVGGIPINVEKRMRYSDRSGGLYIDLYPGLQVLDAKQAEGYLRFRHDAIGDIGRMKRQQKFVKAAIKKLSSPDNVIKLPQLYDVMSKNIRTNMNLFELTKLFNVVKKLDMENINVATLPGKPSEHGYISYWILNAEKTQEIIDQMIYRTESETTGEPISVNLYYTPELASNIDNIKSKLTEQGLVVKYSAQEHHYNTEIIAHNQKASTKKINSIRESIPELNKAQYILEPGETYASGADLTINLGQ